MSKLDGEYRPVNSSRTNGIESSRTRSADEMRLLHHRAKEAQNRKARALRDLEENHPFFDRPLFFIKVKQVEIGL